MSLNELNAYTNFNENHQRSCKSIDRSMMSLNDFNEFDKFNNFDDDFNGLNRY